MQSKKTDMMVPEVHYASVLSAGLLKPYDYISFYIRKKGQSVSALWLEVKKKKKLKPISNNISKEPKIFKEKFGIT